MLPLIQQGKIKALAISSPQRNPDLPHVPTMKGLGIDELTLEFWAGMWAPAGTPRDRRKDQCRDQRGLQSPEMVASMKKLGFETRLGSPRDFAAFIAGKFHVGPRNKGIRRENPTSLDAHSATIDVPEYEMSGPRMSLSSAPASED